MCVGGGGCGCGMGVGVGVDVMKPILLASIYILRLEEYALAGVVYHGFVDRSVLES